MRLFGGQFAFFLGGIISFSPVVYSSFAYAQQVSPIASAFTVRIDVSGGGNGSGVIIARDGNTYYVLTAWHVVDRPLSIYTVYTQDARAHAVDANSIERLSNYDLAVLRFTSFNNYALASISTESLTPSQPIHVSGWLNPLIEITNPSYQFISGNLTGYADPPEEGGYSLIFQNSGFRGLSGGPILDAEHKVVGIIGRGVRAPLDEGLTGLYLGIPISAFMDSQYARYVQASQYVSPGQQSDGVYYPVQREPPRPSNPPNVHIPTQADPPRTSR
jgi:serine protease Do